MTAKNENMDLGNALKTFREKNSFSQEDVASFLSVKREVLSYYENNSREPSLEILQKLANLYGVEMIAFFETNEDKAKTNLAFAFRADEIAENDFKVISGFKKVVMNYLKMVELEKADE